MPLADGTSPRSTRVRPAASRMLTRPSMTSVAYRLPSGSKATSSGATIAPPLALTVSNRPGPTARARIWAAGHRGDVAPAVRAGAHPVRAEQPAGRGDPPQGPAFREAGRLRGR